MTGRRIDRRAFLRYLAASSALPLVGAQGACSADDAQDRTFPQGIASADPTPDGILLWTRVEPAGEVEHVAYVVATDPELADVVASGALDVDGTTDHTVRVELTGLSPATTYWYRFTARGVASPIGRTRTAPLPDADVPLKLALASCQDYGGRWFHGWRVLADHDDVDVVLFIGDYIYETIGHLAVTLPPDRDLELPDGLVLDDPLKGALAATTLADYRALYQQYRRDPDLRAVHARFPFVMLWDDHEFANDCWRDHATDFDDRLGDERSPDRRHAATQAWYEYCALRRPYDPAAASPDDLQIYRSLRWGRHAELVLIDERSYRDDHLIPEGPIDGEVGHIQKNSAFGARTFVIKPAFDAREAAAVPTMLGLRQRDWTIAALTGSTATWKLLASPLVMAQLVVDLSGYDQLPDTFRQRFYFKTDQWDGFRSERRALLEACAGVDNLVVLSGDLHGFYAGELHADFDAPAEPIAVEYAVSAISAPTVDVQLAAVIADNVFLDALGLADLVPAFDANVLATNPHLRHAESTRNGLAIVTVGAEAVDVDFVAITDVTAREPGAPTVTSFRTPRGVTQVLPR
ncbi:MAG TPA: alkaline phosphatase D family protein [Kofleriaceae bacterium]|nr:alkaline phosphatase D family protein [Kofleriaceae bacterium]